MKGCVNRKRSVNRGNRRKTSAGIDIMAEEEALPPRVVLKRHDDEAGPSNAAPAAADPEDVARAHNAQLSWMAAAEEEVRISRLRHSTIACGAHPVCARACLVRSSRAGGTR